MGKSKEPSKLDRLALKLARIAVRTFNEPEGIEYEAARLARIFKRILSSKVKF